MQRAFKEGDLCPKCKSANLKAYGATLGKIKKGEEREFEVQCTGCSSIFKFSVPLYPNPKR